MQYRHGRTWFTTKLIDRKVVKNLRHTHYISGSQDNHLKSITQSTEACYSAQTNTNSLVAFYNRALRCRRLLHFYRVTQLCYRGLGSRDSVRPSVRPSVCLSVCLSVCHMRAL